MSSPTPITEYKFQVGQLVHHRRYIYRGVVFDIDPVCRADEHWYQSNQTQPSRNQPWYHVMVDGAAHTTYVAESNLEPDIVDSPISNPAVERVFQSYYDGRYHKESMN